MQGGVNNAMIRRYALASGVLFSIVAALHLLRVIFGWELRVGSLDIGLSLSIVAIVILVPLAIRAWAIFIWIRKHPEVKPETPESLKS